MSVVISESRKRRRTDDDESGVQMKYYVNQQLVDKTDKNLMQGVYSENLLSPLYDFNNHFIYIKEKTLNLMFAGSKMQSTNYSGKSSNNQISSSPVRDTIDDVRNFHDPK